MSSLPKQLILLSCLILLSSIVLPVLPQHCDQFGIQPPVGPGMPLVLPIGGSQTLTCRHRSPTRPVITILWVHDVSIIREGTPEPLDECSCRVPDLEFSATAKELIFENFAASSAGEYSCRVPDVIGSGTFNICRFDILVAEAPSIRDPQPPSSRTVTLSDTLTIPVSVAGVPTPTITWRNSSTELMNGGRVDISDTGSLTMTGITSYDRGNYSLNLTNIGGNLIRYFSVFVPFVKIVSITSSQVTNNQIMVTCEAVGYPSPSVDWRDSSGNVINNLTQTVTDQHTYEMTYSLTFMVNRDDCQGHYSCLARNRNDGAVITRTMSIDICIGELIQCPHLIIANGQVIVIPPDLLVSSRAIYQCNSGYALVGDDNRICQEDSTWSGDNPKCNDCSQALGDSNCKVCGLDSNGLPVCAMCRADYNTVGGKCERKGFVCPSGEPQCGIDNNMVTTSVISSVVVVDVLAVIGVCICTLVFVRVRRKRAALRQHAYDDGHPIPRLQPQDQQQISTAIDGGQESSIPNFNNSSFANEGEPAESNSLYATIPDTEADVHMRMDENSAYLPSTNFLFATNPAYGTNVGIAPEIETEENAAYHRDLSFDC